MNDDNPAATAQSTAEGLDHERLKALINSMADGVLATDETGIIVLSNGAALNILDVNSTLEGKKIDQVVELIDANNQKIDIMSLILNTKMAMTNRDWRLKYSDDSLINIYISIAEVHLGYGKTGQRGYVLLLRDITHEKSLEEERDEFISVVSHELRTPIAIAEGTVSNTQLLAGKANVDKKITDMLQSTYDQIIFLGSLINDLATLSRAERGKLKVDIEPINAAEMVNSLVNDYEPQAAKKGLYLRPELDPNLELLQSSRLYVKEILQNFITNSIKYTETGGVTVTAHKLPAGVLFEVSDTGIGISKGDQERVFDKFFRSEDYRTRQHSGTGLGLYVTMKLASLIHAELELVSELNKGSTFKITIPNLT